MKTYFTLFFITLCMSTFYAQTPSVSDDEEAIKKVIIAETAASSTTNLEAWADCFVHEPYTFTVHKTKVLWTSENYEKMYEAQKKNFNKPETKANMQMFSNPTRSNWNIQIRGNVAWARFIETVKQADGSDLSLHDLRVLEKQQDNKWRIALLGGFTITEPPVPVSIEEEAIKKVIITQTENWIDGKFDIWSESFVHEPYLTWTVTNGAEPGDALTMRGWEALKAFWQPKFAKRDMAFADEMRKSKTTRDQWQIQIRGNTAYVSFNAHAENDEKKTKMDLTETRVLEKSNGVWKVAMQASIGDFKDATPPIRSKY